MDTVRFGRALGMGARGAAKAMLAAADAAASPRPSTATPRPGPVAKPRTTPINTVGTLEQLRQAQKGLARGAGSFGEAAWRPFVRLGGVLWLELTGVFFGLFVLFAATNAWKLRANLQVTAANHAEHQHFLWSVAMAVLFGYFCVSSFLRAGRRSRGR